LVVKKPILSPQQLNHFSRTVWVYTRETAIASVSCRQFGTIHLKFYCELHFEEPLGTQSF